MTFSPQLEARFDKLLKSYPPGRQRSAMIPMLLYAQDEIGQITGELVDEVATRIWSFENRTIEDFKGPYADYLTEKETTAA